MDVKTDEVYLIAYDNGAAYIYHVEDATTDAVAQVAAISYLYLN